MLKLSQQLYFIRGVAILLVVLGHIIGSRTEGIRQLASQDIGFLQWVYEFIYTFHMPLFFWLSGIGFVLFSKPESAQTFIKSKVLRLLLPMVVWSVVYYCLRVTTGKVKFNSANLISSIVNPDFSFWFFPTLIFCFILSFLLLKVLKSQPLYLACSATLFVLSFFMQEGNLSTWFYFNSFFALGTVAAPHFLASASRKWGYLGWGAILFLAISMGLIFEFFGLNATTNFINGVFGFGAIAILARQVTFTKLTQAIAYFGQISLPIYLMHILFVAIGRTVLLKLKITNLGIHFCVALVVALVMPVLVHECCKKNSFYRVIVGEKPLNKRQFAEIS